MWLMNLMSHIHPLAIFTLFFSKEITDVIESVMCA